MHAIFFEPPIDKNFLGFQFSEIYKERVYEPFFKDKSNLTVVDVGANIGLTTYYFSHYAKKVHAVEPSTEHFRILSQMVKFNELDNVECHKNAIWIKNIQGKLFHNSKNATMYSLHAGVNDNVELAELVDVITIDKFFDDNKIKHCDFLKLDIEGSEFELIGGEGFRKVAPKVDIVFLEYHVWSKRNPNQLRQSLEQNGFKVKVLESSAELIVGVKE